jgi:serine/threonine protein kinase
LIDEDGTTKGWLKVIKTLNITRETDKSRILISILNEKEQVIAKIGGEDLLKEYKIAQKVKNERGFIKFICTFRCDDDFLEHPKSGKDYLCEGQGSKMNVIIMPFYTLGNLGDYNWNSDNRHIFISCVKQAIHYLFRLFLKYGIIHNDFHPRNILLEKSDRNKFQYLGIQLYGIEVILMDFETAYVSARTGVDIQKFYFDIKKFFVLMPTFISNIDKTSLIYLDQYINSIMINNETPSLDHLPHLFDNIDKIIIS